MTKLRKEFKEKELPIMLGCNSCGYVWIDFIDTDLVKCPKCKKRLNK